MERQKGAFLTCTITWLKNFIESTSEEKKIKINIKKKKEKIKKESKGTKWETRRRKNGGRETNSKSYPTLIFQKIKTVMNDKDVLYGNWKKKESDETFYK